jgi:hypothetical protein
VTAWVRCQLVVVPPPRGTLPSRSERDATSWRDEALLLDLAGGGGRGGVFPSFFAGDQLQSATISYNSLRIWLIANYL